mgnify:CR=1 FL=1
MNVEVCTWKGFPVVYFSLKGVKCSCWSNLNYIMYIYILYLNIIYIIINFLCSTCNIFYASAPLGILLSLLAGLHVPLICEVISVVTWRYIHRQELKVVHKFQLLRIALSQIPCYCQINLFQGAHSCRIEISVIIFF